MKKEEEKIEMHLISSKRCLTGTPRKSASFKELSKRSREAGLGVARCKLQVKVQSLDHVKPKTNLFHVSTNILRTLTAWSQSPGGGRGDRAMLEMRRVNYWCIQCKG